MSQDKIRGMLWGVALGDALGSPFEKYKTGIPLSQYNGKLIHNTGKYPPGKVTDDTEMTLTLARYLITPNFF